MCFLINKCQVRPLQLACLVVLKQLNHWIGKLLQILLFVYTVSFMQDMYIGPANYYNVIPTGMYSYYY